MNNYPNRLPGVGTTRTATPKSILRNSVGAVYIATGLVIAGSVSRDTNNTGDLNVIQAGMVMGKVTATGKYAPSILGLSGVLHDTSVVTTTMTLPAAVVTEIQRRIGASGTFKIIGPPTAAGTVATETVTFSAIASATTITITATSADFAAGSIIAPVDGSETPRLLQGDMYGVLVTDEDNANIDVQFPLALAAGYVDADKITFYSSMDASVKTWLKNALNTYGQFLFDDNF